MNRLADMTWEQARALGEVGAVAVLPTGATEAHSVLGRAASIQILRFDRSI